MTRMIRKQIYIQKRQQLQLRRLARARGVSEAEFIRQAIDQQVMLGMKTTGPRDSEALGALIRFALARRQLEVTGRPYRWNREDAYADRAGRYAPPPASATHA
jgi:hypothetical protein